MIVAVVARHNCELIVTTFLLPFVVVLSVTVTSFALQLHPQLLLVLDMVSDKGKPCISNNVGVSEQVRVVWALLRGRGMVGPFASLFYMGQVEGMLAWVS